MTFEDRCEREVHRLHEFFEAWFTGRRTDDVDRVRAALGPEFEMITPAGAVRPRRAVIDGVEAACGSYDDGFEIEIRNLRVRDRTENRCLLTYEEHQGGSDPSARVSTALFVPNDDGPIGVQWRHLHETWLPGGAPDG